MTYHREWWQQAIELVLIVIMSFSFGMIVVAIRGPRRVRMTIEQRKKMGIMGAIAFVIGVVGWMESEKLRAPIARPAPAAPVASDSVTEKSFESTNPPSVKIDAPEGWRVAFDPTTRRLTLVEGTQTLLVVFTRQLEQGGTPSSVRAEVKQQLASTGIAPVEFEESIDGRPAFGLVAVAKDAATGSWSIDRGGGLVSVIQCRTSPERDARTACRPVLDRLRWLTPSR
ncbi:MAG: hypothetical protein ACXVEE_09695 [Polyangiales bacterium]